MSTTGLEHPADPQFRPDRRKAFGGLLALSLTVAPNWAQAGPVDRAAARAAALSAARRNGKPHDVIVRRSQNPESAAHIEAAQRQGQPSVLHVDRAGAWERRGKAVGSVHTATRPSARHDRDEYPPAISREGGVNANVRFIRREDNRSAGARIGQQLRDVRDGEKIRMIVTD